MFINRRSYVTSHAAEHTTVTRYHDLTHEVALTTYSYDDANRMTSESSALDTSGSTVLTYSQTYDLDSRIISLTTAASSAPIDTFGNAGSWRYCFV